MAAPDPVLSTLPPAYRRLVRLMQSIGDGRLRHLHVRDGEPAFDPPPTAVRVLRLGRRNRGAPRSAPVPAAAGREFALRRGVPELVALLRGVDRGTVERLEVADGLPVLVELAEAVAAEGGHRTTSTPTSGG